MNIYISLTFQIVFVKLITKVTLIVVGIVIENIFLIVHVEFWFANTIFLIAKKNNQ